MGSPSQKHRFTPRITNLAIFFKSQPPSHPLVHIHHWCHTVHFVVCQCISQENAHFNLCLFRLHNPVCQLDLLCMPNLHKTHRFLIRTGPLLLQRESNRHLFFFPRVHFSPKTNTNHNLSSIHFFGCWNSTSVAHKHRLHPSKSISPRS